MGFGQGRARVTSLPPITLVTPSYNQAEFLEETIASVLAQHYPALEFFVVDGGSKDQSVEIIRRYASRLSWWVCEKDQGHADAVNKGMARATGEIWGFLNSDDVLFEGALHFVGEYFATHPECLWLAGAARFFQDGPLPAGMRHKTEIWQPRPGLTPWDFLEGCPIPQPSVFWRRSVWERAGPFSCQERGLDHEYYLRLLTLGFRPERTDKVLSGFRLHAASSSVANLDDNLEGNRRLSLAYLPQLFPQERECKALQKRLESLFEIQRVPQRIAAGRKGEALRLALQAIGAQPGFLRRRWVWSHLLRSALPGVLSEKLLAAYHGLRRTEVEPTAVAQRSYIREWLAGNRPI